MPWQSTRATLTYGVPSKGSYSEGANTIQGVTLTCGLQQRKFVLEVISCGKKSLHGKEEFLQLSNCGNVSAIGDLTKDVRYTGSILYFVRIQDAKESRSIITAGTFHLMFDLRPNVMKLPL